MCSWKGENEETAERPKTSGGKKNMDENKDVLECAEGGK